MFNQIGVPDPLSPGMTASGNIIAEPVPEPSTVGLLVATGITILARRRR
jgi:hypothetical protein